MVLVNVSLTPPTVSTVSVWVDRLEADTWRTQTVLPFSTTPAAAVKLPVQFIWY